MTTRLKLIFTLVLLTILAATGWASSQVALWETPRAVATHPWFIATLVDTYLAFFIYWLWVVYKENSVPKAVAWLVLICLTGNMAMAVYALLQLWKLPPGARIEDFLLRRA